MSNLQDTDLFVVSRNSVNYNQSADSIMANLEDTDLLVVSRGGTNYKITGLEFKQSAGPDTGSIVSAPTIVSSSEYPNATLTATVAVVINATQDLTYPNWYKDDVAVSGVETLVYNATSSGTYKYEERWVDDNGNILNPSAEITIQQSIVAKPTVIAPADGAGQGGDVTYTPETSAVTGVAPLPLKFSTKLYDGTGVDQTINTGVNNTDKSLVWIKSRTSNVGNWNHQLFDTVRGVGNFLATNNNYDQRTNSEMLKGFSSSGFTVGFENSCNSGSENYVAWNFRAAAGFFDIVTYEGNGTEKTISHSLGTKPGMIIWKNYDKTFSWYVYHQSEGYNRNGFLNSDLSFENSTNGLKQEPTDNAFTVLTNNTVNGNLDNHVAYLFADKPGLIKCGSYTGNGTTKDVNDVGFTPGWLMIKSIDAVTNTTQGNWDIFDSERGLNDSKVPGSDIKALYANDDGIGGNRRVDVTDNGFIIGNLISEGAGDVNEDGVNYIYVAIAADTGGTKLTLTNDKAFNSADDTEVTTISEAFKAGDTVTADSATAGTSAAFSTTTYNGTGAGQAVDTGLDLTSNKGMLWVKSDTNSTDHCLVDTVRGATEHIRSNTSEPSSNNSNRIQSFTSTGFIGGGDTETSFNDGRGYVAWNFRAAPGFMDIVTPWLGNGISNTAIPHSLESVPGMIIVKSISNGSDWAVWHKSIPDQFLLLNYNLSSATDSARFGPTLPTSTNFYVGTNYDTNHNDREYIAYLFADNPNAGIKCDGYDGSSASADITIDCGFEVGWVLIKRTDSGGDWTIYDIKRDSKTSTSSLYPNLTNDENNNNYVTFAGNGFTVKYGSGDLNINTGNYIYVAIAENAMAGNFPPTGTLSADADDSGPTINLTDVKGTWENGMKVINDKTATKGGPDPAALEFVGSVPAASNGTISTWGNATWSVTTGGVTQTQDVSITSGVQQKLKVSDAADITLDGGTTYDVTVRYDAPDCVGATSDANTFKTSAGPGAFSTTPYEGTDVAQPILTGVDNTIKALVWTKSTNGDFPPTLIDTVNGGDRWLETNTGNALDGPNDTLITSFNEDGYNIGTFANLNRSYYYVSFDFVASLGFFDIQAIKPADGLTFTHDLNQVPGMVIYKGTTGAGATTNWSVWHKYLDSGKRLLLNTDAIPTGPEMADYWGSDPTSTNLYLGSDWADVENAIAYVFADNPAAGIKCGVQEANSADQEVNCGFEPGWVLVKDTDFANDWYVYFNNGSSIVAVNTNKKIAPISDYATMTFSSTGFTVANNNKYIYVAIADTVDTSLFYNTNTKETLRAWQIQRQHGIEPDSNAAKQLGFAELTEQPTYAVSGYELQADGRYKPLRDFSGLVSQLQTQIATLRTTTYDIIVQSKAADHTYYGQGSSNGYYVDGNALNEIQITVGDTIVFDQSDASNSSHPINIYDTADKNATVSGVTQAGTAGSAGASTTFVPTATGDYYFMCQNHGYMGGKIVVS